MRHANISIAAGLTHDPAQSLMAICDYVIYDENALVRQMYQLCGQYGDSKSVVISCAGIGSRLGLGLTKALVQINGGSLISWQLKLFKEVEDLRLVIGFQGAEIIEEVRKYREDVVFCYNHRYFETKTGASYYLGARHANRESLEWDGCRRQRSVQPGVQYRSTIDFHIQLRVSFSHEFRMLFYPLIFHPAISAPFIQFCNDLHHLHGLNPCKIRAETVHLLSDK